jgi:NADPH2 dehydrogenase
MPALDRLPLLLSPVHIAGLALKNRIVMPPMNTAMGVGSEQFRAWYEARARGGVGLIIMEAISVYRLLDDDICTNLQATVTDIKANGVPVVIQLFQPPASADGNAFTPSPVDDTRAISPEELEAIPANFGRAAARCREVGFDGVEPHGAHGFFLNQMFSVFANRRTDRWGGSLDARMTLGVEIVQAIRAEMGAGYPIFYRHTAEEPDGYTVADSVLFIEQLVAAGVDVMDISPSMRGRVHADIAAEVKAQISVPVIAVGGMEDPDMAETALREGKCDLCAVGRQLIADADWAMKVSEGRLDEIIQCTKCDIKCFGNLGQGLPIGCVENPKSGNEYRLV